MQVATTVIANIERHDSDPARSIRVAENLDVVIVAPTGQRPARQLVLTLFDNVNTDSILDFKYQARLECLQHTRRTGFLTLFDATNEVLILGPHVIHRAAGTHTRWQISVVDALVEHENAARSRTAQKLVWRNENRVDRRVLIASWFRVHVDINIGCTSGIVETRHGTILVQQTRYLTNIAAYARYVGRSGE